MRRNRAGDYSEESKVSEEGRSKAYMSYYKNRGDGDNCTFHKQSHGVSNTRVEFLEYGNAQVNERSKRLKIPHGNKQINQHNQLDRTVEKYGSDRFLAMLQTNEGAKCMWGYATGMKQVM